MNKKRKILKNLIFALIVASFVVLTGCSTFDSFKSEFITGADNEDATVKIGVFEPLTGVDKAAAHSEIQGIELAYSMYPTIDGKKVELIYADNRSDMSVAETAISDLIARKPHIILGSYGEASSLTASDYIEEACIPTIAITNTNPLITSTGNYYFRICFVDTYQGEALARYVYSAEKEKQAAVMVDSSSEQATAIAQKFITVFNSLCDDENAVSLELEYKTGDSDYLVQLRKIRDSGIKSVLLPASQTDAERIISQADKMGLDVRFLGTDSWNSEGLVKKVGSRAASKVAFVKVSDVEVADTGSVAYEDFLECYQSKYGEAQEPDSAVALGYDAYLVALKAIEDAGSDATGEELREALASVKDYEGVLGKITFDRTGNPKKSVTVYHINSATGKSYASHIVEVDGNVISVNN